MEYNPLTGPLTRLEKDLEDARKKRRSIDRNLKFQRGFNLKAAEKAVARLTAELKGAKTKHQAALDRLDAANSQTGAIRYEARLGWKPSKWLSAERKGAKLRLAAHREHLAELETECSQLEGTVENLQTRLTSEKRGVSRFKKLDPKALAVELEDVEAHIGMREIEAAEMRARKDSVDKALSEPLKALQIAENELSNLRSQRSSAYGRVSSLESEIRDAERLDRRISNAATSYDRAMLHQECERQHGESSPRRVISQSRRAIEQAKRAQRSCDRQIAAVERKITKLERRVEETARRAVREIHAIVIDGNNLCYQGGEPIGITAVRAACRQLARSYDVTVVFDAGIRRMLRMDDKELRQEFSGLATVHVVASRRKADETVLSAAKDPYVYVLSNDRYAEYPEKEAVRDGRLIQHEIVNGRIYIHDLGIDEAIFVPG